MRRCINNNKYLLLVFCVLLSLSVSACTAVSRIAHYPVRGQVIDAQTGKPIDGAVLALRWGTHKIVPPALASGYVEIKTVEVVTDEDGTFKMPKYPLCFYEMSVYKKGYICWNNRKIFLKGDDSSNVDKLRNSNKIKNGIIIRLEPFTSEYSKLLHARFLNFRAVECRAGGAFMEAAKSEIALYNRDFIERNRRKESKSK